MAAPLSRASLLSVLLCLGCVDLHAVDPRRFVQPSYSQEELRDALGEFSSRFQTVIGLVADRISTSTANREVKRRVLMWRVRIVPLVQEATLEPNPQEAYVSTLTLMILIRQYVTEGDGRELYGDFQQEIVEAVTGLEEQVIEIGEDFIPPQQMTRVVADVTEFARRRPAKGREFGIHTLGKVLLDVEESSVFAEVAQIPLSPFRALGGVGDSSAAIRDFTATARQFIRVAERLPEQSRWQLELLLYDLEDRETTTETLALLHSLAESAEQASNAASRLPEDFRAVMADSGETLGQLERVMREVREAAVPLGATAKSLELASASWAEILRDEPGEKADAPQVEPFDIRDWQAAAHEIGETADRLRALSVELRELTASTAALAPVDRALEGADSRARGWIDLAAWRGLQLIGVFFALLLAYRWIASRIPTR